MYYKIVLDNKVIDVLDNLVYLKYQPKHNRMLLCNESEAQAVFSSDRSEIWHVEGFYDLPVGGYKTVQLMPIDKYEYRRFKVFCGKTPEEIIDEYTKLVLIDKEDSSLVESLTRLYKRQEIDANNVTEVCNVLGVTEVETILVDDKEVE